MNTDDGAWPAIADLTPVGPATLRISSRARSRLPVVSSEVASVAPWGSVVTCMGRGDPGVPVVSSEVASVAPWGSVG